MTDDPGLASTPGSRPVPDIPPDQIVDEPPNGSTAARSTAAQAKTREVEDPKEKQGRLLELVRHYFAMGLAALCLFLLVVMAAVTYIWPRGDLTVIRETADVLKILATASLGYLFGQAFGR